MTSRYTLWSSSGTDVTLTPEYAAKFGVVKDEVAHRTRAQRRFTYTWGHYRRWELPLTYVTTTDATRINSWWGASTLLNFTQDSGTTVHSVQIVGLELPLSLPTPPYEDLRQGTLVLEEYITP